jgi:GntR family transcriptional regulator
LHSQLTGDDAPLYQRIARSLEAQIGSGVLGAGDRLPSERQLASELNASRMTARQAVKWLERRGLVETRIGRGSFVARTRLEKQLRTLRGFTEEMRRGDRKVTSVVLDAGAGAPDREVSAALGLRDKTLIHRLVRLRLVDGQPAAVERTEIPIALAPGLLEKSDFSKTSLYRVLREIYGVVPTEAEESVFADLPDAATAAALGVARDTPVLRFVRRTFDGRGRPFEYVRSSYRGDCFTMRVRLTLTEEP